MDGAVSVLGLAASIFGFMSALPSALIIRQYDQSRRHLGGDPRLESFSRDVSRVSVELDQVIASLAQIVHLQHRDPDKLSSWPDHAVRVDDLFLQLSRTEAKGATLQSMHLRILEIPKPLRNPSPVLFVEACVVYGLAVTVLHRHCRDHKYHWHILWAGTLGACAAGIRDGVDPQGILLSYYPWCLIAALLVSLLSRVWQRWMSLGRVRPCAWVDECAKELPTETDKDMKGSVEYC